MTHDSVLMAELLKDKLEPIGGITTKKMFGGHGVFHDGKMFGIIDSKGHCYFRANKINEVDFEAHGSERHGRMPYFSIPEEVLNDSEKLLAWAKKAL